MRIAIAQILSSGDPAENLETVRDYAAAAKELRAELVVFPEATMCAFGHPLAKVAEPLDGPWASEVRRIAHEFGLVVVAGMFTPGRGGRVRNTLLVCGPGVDTHYDKIHLFDAFGYVESETVDPGESPVVVKAAGATIGLATCYDVRFPALFTANAKAGAQVNIVCASWGAGEGKAEQWDLLTRARAVDSTTFVIAVGQANPASVDKTATGTAPTGIGRSALISPWGTVLHALGEKPELMVLDLDPAQVDEARAKLPVLANARNLGVAVKR
jgi:deaminated glutathione amidase